MSRDYNIAWEVTGNCNHNCFYCYNFWRGDNVMAQELARAAVDYRKITEKLLDIKPVSVSITGGEPLLVFDGIRESIARLTGNGIFIRLLTNAALITDEIAVFLAAHRVQVMVSFPTSDAALFSAITMREDYGDVLRGLDLLKKHRVDVLINVVVSTVNLDTMEQTAEFLINRYGYRVLYFSRATKPQNAAQHLQERLLDNVRLQEFFHTCLKIQKKHKIDVRTCGGYAFCAIRNKKALPIFAKGCGGGRDSFVISSDGSLRICGKDAQVFGNIFVSDVDAIVAKAGCWLDESAIPKACVRCRYRQYCRGGCHMSAIEASPQYNSLDGNADPTRGPLRLPRRKHRIFLNPFRKYVLHEATNYCKTERGNRFSNAFSFVYLSDALTDALRSGMRISWLSVAHKSGCSFKESKRIFGELISKKIITEIH